MGNTIYFLVYFVVNNTYRMIECFQMIESAELSNAFHIWYWFFWISACQEWNLWIGSIIGKQGKRESSLSSYPFELIRIAARARTVSRKCFEESQISESAQSILRNPDPSKLIEPRIRRTRTNQPDPCRSIWFLWNDAVESGLLRYISGKLSKLFESLALYLAASQGRRTPDIKTLQIG